jgi:putative ABC transport system permease protein
MFRNYFKTAFRSLMANKSYSAITVAGLGVGIAVCLVIFVFIRYQESYDQFHANRANIYRILTKGDKPDDQAMSSVPFPLPTALKNDFPDWKVTGIWSFDNLQVKTLDESGKTEKVFKEKDGGFCVDPAFFKIFDFPWLAGDPDKSLADRQSVVLSRSLAERYFGDWRKAVGRSIQVLGPKNVWKVTGVLADPPSNTDLKLNMVFPYAILNFDGNKDWWSLNSSHGCYVLLPPGVGPLTADRQLSALSKKYRTADNKNTQLVQSLADVHFDDKAGNFSGKTITQARIRSLWLIAFFILLIACVNFINISTAQAVNRAKEVGVRKVLGGGRRQIRVQFLLEALLLVLGGVVLAVLLTGILVVPISRVLEIPMSLTLFRESGVLLFLGGTVVVVTLLAGFYPALVLSSFSPITALKTKLVSRSARGLTLRRGLVVLQFVIAQALIIGTFLVVRQLDYFTHTSMGFDKSAIVTVPFPRDSVSRSKRGYLRDRLMAIKDVRMVSYNNSTPANDDNWWTDFKFDHSPKSAPFNAIEKWVDADYVATYSVPLVAGRNISRTDSILEFLVNETFVRQLGFGRPEDVLNKEIILGDGNKTGPVVGVVKDFNQSSLKDSLAGVVMFSGPRAYDAAGIKMSGENLPATIAAIRQVWAVVYPDFVFEYQFLDEKIAGFYKEEAKLSLFYKIFASIAIFLSCLGLYGLASFMAAQRLKEVGIRKVLGATAGNIVYLFSREFVILIGIAFLIAAPTAWYFVHQWVEQYAFRIPISAWVFVAGGMAALMIALGTVSFQAYRAAAVNPVKNLRTE